MKYTVSLSCVSEDIAICMWTACVLVLVWDVVLSGVSPNLGQRVTRCVFFRNEENKDQEKE